MLTVQISNPPGAFFLNAEKKTLQISYHQINQAEKYDLFKITATPTSLLKF